jgi:hypothetical protein
MILVSFLLRVKVVLSLKKFAFKNERAWDVASNELEVLKSLIMKI